MQVVALAIEGFRGIQQARLLFGDHSVLVGPNSTGKTTILDALALVFGRTQLTRDLTEHDFYGSKPEPTSRLRIVATLADFRHDDPDKHADWFGDGRGVPKWWNASSGKAEPNKSRATSKLCVEIGFCARFDREDLEVERCRYFHDDAEQRDPFDEDGGTALIRQHLLHEVGFYMLPVRRTWEATASFASELFRKAVATFGGIPAETLLDERDRLRKPTKPLEDEPRLKPLVDRVNAQLAQLLPQAPTFQLRLTATDSEALLRALVPHYLGRDGVSLPAGRHGTGLLSLQLFILLLEIGRARRAQGLSFILAMEEPELHVAPGLQRRLLAQAVSIAGQTISSTHSPRVGAFYPATAVQFVERVDGDLRATPLLTQQLTASATQVARKLFHDDRARVVEALMHHRVLIPEGRADYEWLRVLADAAETGDAAFGCPPRENAPFGAVIGVIPTHNSAVTESYRHLKALRAGFLALVDGDQEGHQKVKDLLAIEPPPGAILQWPEGWEIEDLVAWILEADEASAITALQPRLTAHAFAGIAELRTLMKQKTGDGRLKGDYLAYEEIAGVIQELERCSARAAEALEAITAASLGKAGVPHLHRDSRSTGSCSVIRFEP